MAKTKQKAIDRVTDVKPYVERALKDEDLRDNVRAAFEAARDVYDELTRDRGVTGIATKVASDKDIQDNLRKTVDELRTAADRLQGKEDRGSRKTLLLLVAVALGILFNPVTGPKTRSWVKERVLGPSDDFTYGGNSGSGSTGT